MPRKAVASPGVASSLLRFHRLLIGAALALAIVLVLWGAVHGVTRGEPGGWVALLVGGVAAPACALYLRKILLRPPIR